MSNTSTNDLRTTVRICGMHCASCEILLERKLLALDGMKHVSVNHKTGVTKLIADGSSPPSYEEVESVVKSAGYRLSAADSISLEEAKEHTHKCASECDEEPNKKWFEIGGALLIIFAAFKFLSAFDLVSLAPATTGVLSFGGIFVIGLVAGMSSCLAVTGGLLLAAAAKYNEVNQSQTSSEKFRPLLRFNIGRLISYFVLGGVVGLIGKSITLTPKMTGYLNIFIALVMLSIALSILKILPKHAFGFKTPKALSHWIHDLAANKHPLAPSALGAMTFFLPCGFTQSLQLVALASGNFWAGAMTMGIFALGTLPALLSISAISSAASGAFSRIFLRFSGALVLVLSFFNLNSALALTGFDVSGILNVIALQPTRDEGVSPNDGAAMPSIVNNMQEVFMKVEPRGYQPNVITVKAGIPVRWTVDGTNARGCNNSLVVPSLGISRILQSGQNIIEFTPKNPGRILFSCSMGMYRGYFNVI